MAFKKWFIAAGVLAAGVVLAVVVALPVLRITRDPAERMVRLWKRQGLEKPNVILISLDTTRRSPGLLRLRERENAGDRRSRASRRAILPGRVTGSTDTAGAQLDDDGLLSDVSRRAFERHDRTQSAARHARRSVFSRGISNGRLRRRLRAGWALGPQSGLQRIRRSLRHEEGPTPRPGRHAAARERSRGRRATMAGPTGRV